MKLTDADIGLQRDPVEEYKVGIRAAKSLSELVTFIEQYELVAWDALERACALDEADFADLQAGLADKRKQKKRWASKFGEIVIPNLMLGVSLKALELKVPFGLVYGGLEIWGC